MKKPLIIAHRGASALAPENTLAAFRRAIADGAEGIEFDVQLAKDKIPVVFHDADLRRIAGKNVSLKDLTAAQLGKINAGSWFNQFKPHRADNNYSREKVSTLAEVLDFLRDFPGLIYVELKSYANDYQELAEIVCRTIADFPSLVPQIIVKSFQLEALPHVRRFCPNAQTAALFEPKLKTVLRRKTDYVKIARDFAADQLSVHFSLASRKLIESAENLKMPVTIWTADNPLWVRRATERNIAAIITNNPARLLAKKVKISSQDI